METLREKTATYGTVEVRDDDGAPERYGLYVNGELKEASENLEDIIREFERY